MQITSGLLKSATRQNGFVICFSSRSWKNRIHDNNTRLKNTKATATWQNDTLPVKIKKQISFLISTAIALFIIHTTVDYLLQFLSIKNGPRDVSLSSGKTHL